MKTIVLRIAAWGCLALIVVLSLGPVDLRPVGPAGVEPDRFIAFVVLGLLFGMAYPKRLLLVLVLLVASAACLELAQNLVVGRHGRLLDGSVKAFGAVCGMGLARVAIAIAYYARRRSP